MRETQESGLVEVEGEDLESDGRAFARGEKGLAPAGVMKGQRPVPVALDFTLLLPVCAAVCR